MGHRQPSLQLVDPRQLMNRSHPFSATAAWAGLAVIYLGFLTIGFVFHFVPPILPLMLKDLGISHSQAGLLMSLFALPGILLSLPGGWLADRVGAPLMGGAGLLVMGIGALGMGLAPGFGWILAARTVAGIGVAFGVVALQRMIATLFAGRPLGVPMGVSGTAVPLGIIIILNVSGPWGEAHGWRSVAVGTGMVTIVAAVVFFAASWFVMRRRAVVAPESPGEALAPTSPRGEYRVIWIAAVVWFCANGAMTSFMTFAPDHFFELGWSVSDRGLVTSIPMWGSVLLGPLIGWLTDRFGRRGAFITAGMGLMAVSLAAIPGGGVPQVLLGMALGAALAAVVTPLLSLPGTLLPPDQVGRGFGILATFANLGIFFCPPLVGMARDHSGEFTASFLLMGAIAAMGVVAGKMLRQA